MQAKKDSGKAEAERRDIVAVKSAMKPNETFEKLALTFKVLGDPSRTKIIFALSNRELSVHQVASLLDMSQSAVSHQLSILRHMELVKIRRDGRISYYALDDSHISNLFEEGIRHVEE